MKFTLAVLSTLAAAAQAGTGTLTEGMECYVQFKAGNGKAEGKYWDYGDDTCGKDLDCNYLIGDDGHVAEPIAGRCELTKCLGSNGNKPPGDGTDRITICHRTCSTTNPWVRITIDRNGWDDTSDGCGHGVQHDIWDDCKASEEEALAIWGADHDFILKEHGTRSDVMAALGVTDPNDEVYKQYWRNWEPACPYVRNGQCCDLAMGNCCGVTEESTSGGDPHFARWGQEHDTFHGECDLVLAKSETFLGGAGLDVHVRTTLASYYSYIETAAIRVGKNKMEFHNDHFFVGDVMYTPAELPMTLDDGTAKVTIANSNVEGQGDRRQNYKLHLGGSAGFELKFYKNFMTIRAFGSAQAFGGSVGLLGDYYTGDMVARDGSIMTDFEQFAFEWQVNPDDEMIFREARAPQLPFEQCRMPTAPRPSRRHLRADNDLYEKAAAACANASNIDLCVNDVLMTNDVGLAEAW